MMKKEAHESVAVSPRTACRMLDYGMTRLYELLGSGELEAFRDGRSTRITTASINAYVARQMETSRWSPGGERIGA